MEILHAVQEGWNRHVPVSFKRWVGYRESGWKPNNIWYVKYGSIFFATMGAMLANEAVVLYAPLFHHKWHVETLVPSFAASCILIYGSLQAPFSQPRNLVFGHFISALVGVCIMKLFMTGSGNEKYLWLSGSLSVALASVLMEVSGTVHPPSGATALLPSVDGSIRRLGWNYLPVMLIHSCLFLGIALLCNNICRRYPFWWVSPPAPPSAPPSGPAPTPAPNAVHQGPENVGPMENSLKDHSESTNGHRDEDPRDSSTPNTPSLHSMRTSGIVLEIPEGFILSLEERNLISRLKERLDV